MSSQAMEMEEISPTDSQADKDQEERVEPLETEVSEAVLEAAEGADKEEENIYSKLQNPPEDVYHMPFTDKQPQKFRANFTRFRTFRALAAVLSVICLILLIVIVALAMKLQTLSACSDTLGETDSSSVCSKGQCMALYPQRQVHASKCSRCERGWFEFESSCFLFSSDSRSWSESRRECQNRGAYLAIPNQGGVQNFLSQTRKGYYYWIGLSRSASGAWAWLDNSPVGKRSWSEKPGEDCVYLYGASLTPADCSHVAHYICQKDR